MLIGGVSVSENAKALTGGCHVAVGTPGRIRFLMTKGLLRTSTAQTLVLDSADWLMAPVFQASFRVSGGVLGSVGSVVACVVCPERESGTDFTASWSRCV